MFKSFSLKRQSLILDHIIYGSMHCVTLHDTVPDEDTLLIELNPQINPPLNR